MDKFNKNFISVLTISLFSLIALQTGLGLFAQTRNVLGLQDISLISPPISKPTSYILPTTMPPQPVCKTGVNSFNVYTACEVGRFRYTVFKCYDGTTSTQGGPTSCKTSAEWQSIAQSACAGKSSCLTPTPTPVVRAVPCDSVMKIYNNYCYANNSALTFICSSLKSALYPYCPFLPPNSTPTPPPRPTFILPTPTLAPTIPYLNIVPSCVGTTGLTATVKGEFENFNYKYQYYWTKVTQPNTGIETHYSTVAAVNNRNYISEYLRSVITDIKTGKPMYLLGNGQTYYFTVFGTDSYDHAGNSTYSTAVVSQYFKLNCGTSTPTIIKP